MEIKDLYIWFKVIAKSAVYKPTNDDIIDYCCNDLQELQKLYE